MRKGEWEVEKKEGEGKVGEMIPKAGAGDTRHGEEEKE